MRSTLRILVLAVILLLVLVPLAAQADGPCPDDPEKSKDCSTEPNEFYVVINREFEDLSRPGTGCQPIILKNPDCERCCDGDDACLTASEQVEERVCPILAKKVDWTAVTDHVPVYEMCCDCASDPDGQWTWRVRQLEQNGDCPVFQGCTEGLPPGTGIDLPAPVILGGLVAIGAVLLAAGLLVRRRTLRVA